MSDGFRLAICGDMVPGEYEPRWAPGDAPNAGRTVVNEMRPLLTGCDEVIVNLETVLGEAPGTPIAGKVDARCAEPAPTTRLLKELGVTAVTLANNHSMDFGARGLRETIAHLHAAGIATMGAGEGLAAARAPRSIAWQHARGTTRIHVFSGMRSTRRYVGYGFFAGTRRPGVASTNFDALAARIRCLRQDDPHSLIIVIPHWQGIEYRETGAVHQRWCRGMIDAGTDCVIAHGSHTLDRVERYRQGLICYSIGNFVFGPPGRFDGTGAMPVSAVVQLSLEVQANGKPRVRETLIPIAGDNRDTHFRITPLRSVDFARYGRALESLLGEHQGVSVRSRPSATPVPEFLARIDTRVPWEYHGDPAAPMGGLELRPGPCDPRCFHMLVDEAWPRNICKFSRLGRRSLPDLLKRLDEHPRAGLVIARRHYDPTLLGGRNVLVVEDGFQFFLDTARSLGRVAPAPVVAVTGSAGKTTTLGILQDLLEQVAPDSRLLITEGNQNLFRDSLSKLTRLLNYDLALLEVAAANAYARHDFHMAPDIAVLTGISTAHLEYLGNLENVARVKSRLFEGMPRDGTAIINADSPFLDLMRDKARKQGCEVLLYGEDPGADIHLEHYDFATGEVRARFAGERFVYSVGQAGRHIAVNSLACLAVMARLGLDWKAASAALARFRPIAGRGQVLALNLRGQSVTVLDESYNANPLSMRAALGLLREHGPQRSGRRIAVLGDMLELGKQAAALHAGLIDDVLGSTAEQIVLVGETMQALWPLIPSERQGALLPDTTGLPELLERIAQEGDVILFKASNKVGLSDAIARLAARA